MPPKNSKKKGASHTIHTLDEIESVDFTDFTEIENTPRLLILNSVSKQLSLYDCSKQEYIDPPSHPKILQNASTRGEIYKRSLLYIIGPCLNGKHLFLDPQTPGSFFLSDGMTLRKIWQDPTREKEKPIICCEVIPNARKMIVFTDRSRIFFAQIEPFKIISSRRKFWITKTSWMASMMNREQSEDISFSPNGRLCFVVVGEIVYEILLNWNMKVLRMIHLRRLLKLKEEMNPNYCFQVIDSHRLAVCHQNKLAVVSYCGKKINMIQVGDSINTMKPFIYFKKDQIEYFAVWGSRLEVRSLTDNGELIAQENSSQRWVEKVSYSEALNCLVILGRKNNAKHQLITYISLNQLVVKN